MPTQTITTKFLCPTDRRGARIQASTSDGNAVTTPYDHACRPSEAHAQALWRWLERHAPKSRHARWASVGDGDTRHWLPVDMLEVFARPAASFTEAR